MRAAHRARRPPRATLQNNATFAGNSAGGDSFQCHDGWTCAYRAHAFVVDLEGSQKTYNLAVAAVFDYDGDLYLYSGSFDPSAPQQNLVAYNDYCNDDWLTSCITLSNPEPGPFVLVVSAYFPYPVGGLYTAVVSLDEVGSLPSAALFPRTTRAPRGASGNPTGTS